MNSEQLNATRLAQIKERAEKATPGPWYFDKGVKERGDRRPAVIEYFDFEHGETFIHGDISNIDDAEFIAHAREDIPQLVAEVERLRSGLETIQERLFSVRGRDSTHDSEVTGVCIDIRKLLDGDDE